LRHARVDGGLRRDGPHSGIRDRNTRFRWGWLGNDQAKTTGLSALSRPPRGGGRPRGQSAVVSV